METADAESGMASPGMFTLNPVNDAESLERNADDGKGSRQWSGFVLSQKLFYSSSGKIGLGSLIIAIGQKVNK